MFSTTKRTLFGIGIEVVWVVILASLAPLAYFIKKWREIRLVIFIVLGVLAIISYWLVEESIRWLISINKLKRADAIIDRIASFNRLKKKSSTKAGFDKNRKKLDRYLSELSLYNHVQEKVNKKSSEKTITQVYFKKINTEEFSSQSSVDLSRQSIASSPIESSVGNSSEKLGTLSTTTGLPSNIHINNTVKDIFKYSKFRLYVIIMALNWFATALVYDGLTYMNNYIGDNIYVNWILMNIIELPAQFVCYIVVSRFGRRLTVAVTLVLSGVTLLLTLTDLIPSIAEITWLKLTLFVLAKFIVTQSYTTVIIHAPELFPTNLRLFLN